jgi:polar amino acid transport system permease protein
MAQAGLPEPTQGSGDDPIRAVPVRHPGRWVAAVLIVILAASLIRSAATNPNFEWDTVGEYLFSDRILNGVVVTIELTVIAMVVGVVLGVLLAILRLSPNPLVTGAGWLFVWFFRGVPRVALLLFFFAFAALYPEIGLGVPFGGPNVLELNSNELITSFAAAILALGLSEAAYMAEIVRAGLLSVDEGQTDAAHALGMTRMQTLRRIVLPQAMKVIIPPTGNETISMLKDSALVVVIGLAPQDLMTTTQDISAKTYEVIALYIVAIIWYLALTSVLSVGQYFIERRFSRGTRRSAHPTALERMRRRLAAARARPSREGGGS